MYYSKGLWTVSATLPYVYTFRVFSEKFATELAERARTKLPVTPWVHRYETPDDTAHLSPGATLNAINPHGEQTDYCVLERKHVQQLLPEVTYQYLRTHQAVQERFGRPLLTSPFYRSSVNLNLYWGAGTCHAAHTDSNPVATILCLSEGTPLELWVNGAWEAVRLSPGEIAAFEGKRIAHRVPPAPTDQFRLVVSSNLYFPEDCSRPDDLDQVVYGKG